MDKVLSEILKIATEYRDFMWGNWMVALLVGTGILLTILTAGVQFRKFARALKLFFTSSREKGKKDSKNISPFAALMTALAATVGNGNIAGVAAAIATGGPGAPFWMWISALFGLATKYAEGFLGVYFREKNPDGSYAGGPMYYCAKGIKNKKLGKILGAAFAIFGGFAALFGTGNMAQSNSMALAIDAAFKKHGLASGFPFWISGLIITFLTGLVVIGGIKRIAAVAEKLVPAMILLYFGGTIILLIKDYSLIPKAFETIFLCAFNLKAVGGAAIGIGVKRVISLGVSRGVLSNEAGLGSAAIAQSASWSKDPKDNGLIAMLGVFIDTILVNTLTTLMIVVTGAWLLTPAAGGGSLTSTALTSYALETAVPYGSVIIALASFIFGYTTLIGWCYYGEICWEYIFGWKSIYYYRTVYIVLLFLGAVIQGKFINIVWFVGEASNAFMAIPNLLGLLFLSGLVAYETKKMYGRKSKNV